MISTWLSPVDLRPAHLKSLTRLAILSGGRGQKLDDEIVAEFGGTAFIAIFFLDVSFPAIAAAPRLAG